MLCGDFGCGRKLQGPAGRGWLGGKRRSEDVTRASFSEGAAGRYGREKR